MCSFSILKIFQIPLLVISRAPVTSRKISGLPKVFSVILGERVKTQAKRRTKFKTIIKQYEQRLQVSLFLSIKLSESLLSKAQSTFKSQTQEQSVEEMAKTSQAANMFWFPLFHRQDSTTVSKENKYLMVLKNYNYFQYFFLSYPCRMHWRILYINTVDANMNTAVLAGFLQELLVTCASVKSILKQQQPVYTISSKGVIKEASWSVAHETTNGTPIKGESMILNISFIVKIRLLQQKIGKGLNKYMTNTPQTMSTKYWGGKAPKLMTKATWRAQMVKRAANKVERRPAIFNISVEGQLWCSLKSRMMRWDIMKCSKQSTFKPRIQTQNIMQAIPLQVGKSLLKIGSVQTDFFQYARSKLMKTMTATKTPTHSPKMNVSLLVASLYLVRPRKQSLFIFLLAFLRFCSIELVKLTQKSSILSRSFFNYLVFSIFSSRGSGVSIIFWAYFFCFFSIFLSASKFDSSIFFKQAASMQVNSLQIMSRLRFSQTSAIRQKVSQSLNLSAISRNFRTQNCWHISVQF